MESRKTLLFNNEIPWIKKEGNGNFDVPMGCHDGAEVCEIVGSYLLNLLCEILDKEQVGPYRDDGLAVVKHLSRPQIEQKRKNIIKIFKDNGLNITIQASLKVVKFLDVELNLNNGIFRPYRKPDNIPVYINKKSNILQQSSNNSLNQFRKEFQIYHLTKMFTKIQFQLMQKPLKKVASQEI